MTEFEVFDITIDDKTISLTFKEPNKKEREEASKVYNRTFRNAIESGALLRARLDDFVREQGLWDDKKQEKFTKLQEEIYFLEKKIEKGGYGLKDAKKDALNIKGLRDEINRLLMDRRNLDNNTAEGQADDMRFNYLLSACTIKKEDGKAFFESLDDYLNKSTTPYALSISIKFARLFYGLDANFADTFTENKFLKKYKFVDDQGRLINKDGKLVDEDNKLIDEHGRYIDENGVLVDKWGNKVNETGELLEEAAPFLDDEGNAVVV